MSENGEELDPSNPFDQLLQEATWTAEFEEERAMRKLELLDWLWTNGHNISWAIKDQEDFQSQINRYAFDWIVRESLNWESQDKLGLGTEDDKSQQKCELQAHFILQRVDPALLELATVVLPGEGLSSMDRNQPFVAFYDLMTDQSIFDTQMADKTNEAEVTRVISTVTGKQPEQVLADGYDRLIVDNVGYRVTMFREYTREEDRDEFIAQTESLLRETFAHEGKAIPPYLSEVVRQAFEGVACGEDLEPYPEDTVDGSED